MVFIEQSRGFMIGELVPYLSDIVTTTIYHYRNKGMQIQRSLRKATIKN